MKETLVRKSLISLMTVAVALSPLSTTAALAVEATSSAGSSQSINNDPNNWYQQWLARRAAMDAQLAAAANTQTGADSTNTAETTTTNDTTVGVDNTGQIVNVTDADSVTGYNDANRNTGDGSATSGDSGLVATIGSTANQVSINGLLQPGVCSITTCAGGSAGDASNSKTGADSTNEATVSDIGNTGILINNDLDIINRGTFNSISGYNDANRNTGDGTVVAGDADLSLTALNVGNNVNVGAQVFNIMDDQTGDIVLNFDNIQTLQTAGGGSSSSNDTTGAGSTNNATTTNDGTSTILINNDGSLNNDYVINAITGHNDASRNTGDGSITTGDANVAVNVINFLNNTFLGGAGDLLLGIVNIFGSVNGNIVVNPPTGGSVPVISPESLNALNSTTGAVSDNTASTTNNNTLGIGIQNTADVLNGITLNANTGENDASKNTGSSLIQSGNVDAALKTTNIANTTSVGGDGTLWLVLINNLGTWTGQLMGLDVNGVASPFFTFTVGPDGSLNAVNNQTGADSTNNAEATNNNTTEIGVNNNGVINNNVVINADTGHNTASLNTGNGSIQTGDVNVAANVMNILNNTFIGSKMVITIVNVFGSFFGNILTPGSEQIGSAALPAESGQPALSSAASGNTAQHAGSGGNTGSKGTGSSGSSNTNTGAGSTNTSQVSQAGGNSLVLSANEFGTPRITKVVSETGRLGLREIIFTLIVTAATAHLLMKLARRGWLTRKTS